MRRNHGTVRRREAADHDARAALLTGKFELGFRILAMREDQTRRRQDQEKRTSEAEKTMRVNSHEQSSFLKDEGPSFHFLRHWLNKRPSPDLPRPITRDNKSRCEGMSRRAKKCHRRAREGEDRRISRFQVISEGVSVRIDRPDSLSR